MLSESKLYNFFDTKNSFSISFLEGQKLINDLVFLHSLKPQGFNFFRDSVLSSTLLINYLKPQENMGFFIDSDEPYFRLKVEMNFDGYLRTLLLPETFDLNPTSFNGRIRLIKIMPNSSQPYQSVLSVNNQSVKELVNKILSDSYQFNSKVLISEYSDQSILLSRLPNVNINKNEIDERISLDDYLKNINDKITMFFQSSQMEQSKIEDFFKTIGFELLTVKDIQFKCNCSKERMTSGVASVAINSSIEELFENLDTLEAKCDYCKTKYEITKQEVTEFLGTTTKH